MNRTLESLISISLPLIMISCFIIFLSYPIREYYLVKVVCRTRPENSDKKRDSTEKNGLLSFQNPSRAEYGNF
jgi:hypothetical protein